MEYLKSQTTTIGCELVTRSSLCYLGEMTHAEEKPKKPEKETEKGKEDSLEESLSKFSVVFIKQLLRGGKNVGMGGALVTSLGLGTYSAMAPEEEARIAYDTLRPVVQENTNDAIRLQARVNHLEEDLEEALELIEKLRVAVESQSRRKSSQDPAMKELAERLQDISRRERVETVLEAREGHDSSMKVLPKSPWQK